MVRTCHFKGVSHSPTLGLSLVLLAWTCAIMVCCTHSPPPPFTFRVIVNKGGEWWSLFYVVVLYINLEKHNLSGYPKADDIHNPIFLHDL